MYTYPNCHTCTPNLTAVHVHHFLYYKLCRAVDIFQNLCWPVAIRAVDIFCLKVKLLESSWSLKINWIWAVDKKESFAWMVWSSWYFCVDQFFEQSNFEQLIVSQLNVNFNKLTKRLWTCNTFRANVFFFQRNALIYFLRKCSAHQTCLGPFSLWVKKGSDSLLCSSFSVF